MNPLPLQAESVVALLRRRAAGDPGGYTFLADGEGREHHRGWSQLDERARAVAATLQRTVQRGDRALLMFEEGLEFLDALFGCMYAGVLAVPVHAPDPGRLARTLPRMQTVAKDAGVSAVLTTAALERALRAGVGDLGATTWIAVDAVDSAAATRWADPAPTLDDLAYLQYTSGSTSAPKGVMVSHRNLLHQLADFDLGYEHDQNSVIVSWLPATHDLGLVYGRLMALYVGCRCVFFDAAAFMQRPARWMRVMARYGGTHSPSPNFGFEVAARKAEDPSSLDLSRVKVLLNGAEPIRRESEELFQQTYAAGRLPASAITHAMGMSESTAKIITEPIRRAPARFVTIDGAAYERNEVVLVSRGAPNSRDVASNGRTHGDTRVVVVDKDTLDKLPEGRVGEMWVAGTTVAQGYWNNPAATEETFRARTSDGDGPFLRTGDLAFVLDGEVYLSGRVKDLIIIRGQNHHPQDLEWSVASAHAALRPNCAAAFSVQADGAEQLVLVSEVYEDRLGDPDAVFAAIRGALAEHGLAARAIALLPARGLPKTSSGKIQRALARAQFEQGALPTLFRWTAAEARPSASAAVSVSTIRAAPASARAGLLADYVRSVAAALLGVGAADVELDRPFGELGLDSITAVEMVEKVGAELGLALPGTALFDHPTVERLAAWLAGILVPAGPAQTAPAARASAPRGDVASMSEAEAEEALRRELEDL